MKNRIFYLDFLKGISIFFVVMLHVSALGLSMAEIGSFTWKVCNVVDSSCRFVVPIFVMISGALLLDENRDFHIKKSIKRLFIPLILWSVFYAFIVTTYQMHSLSYESIISFLTLTFLKPTHNWFLYMLIGVYLTIPLLRSMVKNGKDLYFIMLWLIFGVLIPFLKNFEIFSIVCSFTNRFSLTLPLGYIGYFILGFYLNKIEIKPNKVFIGALTIISILIIICNSLLTHHSSTYNGRLTEIFYDYMSPAVVIYSACLFLIIKTLLSDSSYHNNKHYSKYILLMSRYSLAIYMFHEFILILVQKVGINPTIANPIIMVFILSFAIYSISFLIIHICARCSFFSKNLL